MQFDQGTFLNLLLKYCNDIISKHTILTPKIKIVIEGVIGKVDLKSIEFHAVLRNISAYLLKCVKSSLIDNQVYCSSVTFRDQLISLFVNINFDVFFGK